MRRLLFIALGAALVGYAAGCRVNIPDDQVFSCDRDNDCGGGGFVCVNEKYCCKPDGTEAQHACNGKDDDCNGMTDEGAGQAELCNGLDDDCDGRVDNGFDLIQDPRHCGSCERTCNTNQACMNGICVLRGETSCTDAMDNDADQKIDCEDPDCNLAGCGPGCQCRVLAKAEGNCNDDADNDGDGMKDCADIDCAGAGCGTGGCSCIAGAKKEIDCRDGMDNDGDTLTDCADPDCGGQLCQAAPATFACAGTTCSCNDGGTVTETGVRCRDRIDNDCDGLLDCAEAACDGVSCSPDGGAGCLCGTGQAKETSCADRRDNDNDGFTDCGDVLPDGGGDCPATTACTFVNTSGMVTNGTCAADHTCK